MRKTWSAVLLILVVIWNIWHVFVYGLDIIVGLLWGECILGIFLVIDYLKSRRSGTHDDWESYIHFKSDTDCVA